MKCGLIGEKLGHSFSKEIHQKLGDYEYDLIELAPDELEGFILSGDFDGLNVTIPYKQAVMGYLDEISDLAREAGAVNTVVNKDGKLAGYNTDCGGMKPSVCRSRYPSSSQLRMALCASGFRNAAFSPLSCSHASKCLSKGMIRTRSLVNMVVSVMTGS